MKKKLSLDELKVKSFVTSENGLNTNTIKGGSLWQFLCNDVSPTLGDKCIENTKEVVNGGCWISERTTWTPIDQIV